MLALFKVPEKEKEYQSYMVFVHTVLWSVVIGVIVSVGFYFFPHLWVRWASFLTVSIFIAVFHLSLNSYGYVRVASWSLTIFVWLFITVPCYSAGGMNAPGIVSQTSVILTAGFLLGWKGGFAFGLLTIGADFSMAYMEVLGLLPIPSVMHTPITRWIGAFIPFSTIIALQYHATNHLRSSLLALQREIIKREEAEKEKDQTVSNLKERVKELKTLYTVNKILQDEDTPLVVLFKEMVQVIPNGWQYPEITSACVSVNESEYITENFKPSAYYQRAKGKTAKGTSVSIEVRYSQVMSECDEGPFLKEERNLITMLVEMLKLAIERREHKAELKDYKYALDIGYSVSISENSGSFTFVNENFCNISKYSTDELLGKNHSILWSGMHTPEYFGELRIAMESGKPFKGEFCNKAKDGTLYWVDTTIVPFLDENGKIYQFLSINHDITERKESEEKIKRSEELLRKITSQIPGNTYMFEIAETGDINILFMSHGSETFKEIYEAGDVTKRPTILSAEYYGNDKDKFTYAMKEANKTQTAVSVQYRVVVNNQIRWRWMQAIPEKNVNKKTLWYGATTDITPIVDYMTSIEQIIFDIGHVIRRPISSMLGMTQLIMDHNLSETEVKEISRKLYIISQEMDKFIGELNIAYNQKKLETKMVIDVSPTINKRHNLFQ
jgi:PAS domain S-box-containing protein